MDIHDFFNHFPITVLLLVIIVLLIFQSDR